ncbi:MAG: YqeG family HAD IIIA-type phosphatase [Clostridia bacterium]|nr:YqeG family HAD IIIA-type phosphatase [Clostridia bacterium]
MPKTIVPDFVFDSFKDVSAEFLKKNNIKALLSDVDNTLSPYEHDVPNGEVKEWIKSLHENGIKIALVSNNNYERINKYNKEMKLVAYADAKKPSRKFYYRAASDLGVDIKDCAVLGDQLLTDCWSARRVGIKCIIVPPIKDKRDLFHRFKRAIEVPFMYAYKKKNK